MKDDQVDVEICIDEMQMKAPMELVLQPITVFQLVGLIQLALRHPGCQGAARAAGDRFVGAARTYFADCAMIADVIRRGDDPSENR